MRRDYIDFQDRSAPVAYLITFRCYGTWLHGDERGSVGRNGTNIYGEPKIKPSCTLQENESGLLKRKPYVLGVAERSIVEKAVREVCAVRNYGLFAIHVRTNHAHVVTSDSAKPERMMDSFKAYSTRALRAAGLIDSDFKLWSRHGSTRYLWTDGHIEAAVEYVVNGQGGELPRFN